MHSRMAAVTFSSHVLRGMMLCYVASIHAELLVFTSCRKTLQLLAASIYFMSDYMMPSIDPLHDPLHPSESVVRSLRYKQWLARGPGTTESSRDTLAGAPAVRGGSPARSAGRLGSLLADRESRWLVGTASRERKAVFHCQEGIRARSPCNRDWIAQGDLTSGHWA